MSSKQSIEMKIRPLAPEDKPNSNINEESQKGTSVGTYSGLRIGSILRMWAEVSRINYLSTQPLDVITSGQSILRRRSIGLPAKEYSIQYFVPSELRNKSEEDLFAEQFPINVTPLMNEDQLWGCFYIFPELYSDVYSPVVRIRDIQDVPELVGGVLTRDAVTPCLSYLKRTPILGDFVYIKLDLSSKHLINIDVLQHYKYLVYLDLSSNLLTDISVLTHLPYLQFLSVAFNRLSTVLEYPNPQWFLTEVHYKFNSVKRIRDLSLFWSITILDLSHNNIKCISGLENLRYLRRLDLSFNHIQRLENLNHLRLLWLDVSYNNISSFEFNSCSGLWTLLHLEYLNLNENNLVSLRMFSGCTRLRELHARNNRLSMLLELAVYMRQMRRLIVLDLRANPICSTPGYKDVIINTFPILMCLDAEQLDPVEQWKQLCITKPCCVHSKDGNASRPASLLFRTSKMDMNPDVNTFATRRLLRLLYIEQLSRARVSPHIPPADSTEVPIVVLVGYEAVGKGTLARRLASECRANIALACQHTTAPYHYPGHYREITRSKFDDMLLAGELLTYCEMDGESYGLSREEAFIKDGKVKIVSMDLLGALMLKLRGRRPYLILASCEDKKALAQRQQYRKKARNMANQRRISLETPLERSTLQVLLSGRIIITGILNEILLSATSLEEACKRSQDKNSQMEPSLYSLYKESQGTDEYVSYANGQNSYQERNQAKKSNDGRQSKTKQDKHSSFSHPKSVDFSRYASSTWKGFSVAPDGSKSSKSVTFTSQDNDGENQDPLGMLIEPRAEKDGEKSKAIRSISTRIPWPRGLSRLGSGGSLDDQDLWLAFLTETGLVQSSDVATSSLTDTVNRLDTKIDSPDSIIQQMDYYHKTSTESDSTTIRDDYEEIHRKSPGMFWDSVYMDDPEEAFIKVKRIIREIVESQVNIKPMFDIDFANLNHYPNIEKRLIDIRNQIAPQRLFY
ncbi:leucine-rich repeat and guanylate kinase domain-containing protein isoform X3 [Manduca sexta]|uniref:Guanylate kinase-like domain-containing protein n=1 Tax=Manduca sexta TaxID=7130 RepID=A0A921YQZ4_MANSE|nr:leucine-rich repeat and guanylate kinase domain-containing protein isoform X3 [Manduca sexta]KAG6443319.1 hypothetical protein O3G_MSEX002751 [Manduca sexta]